MADPKAPPAKKGPSVLLVLVALILLALSVYVVAAYVQVAPCPGCDGTGVSKLVHNDLKTGVIGTLGGECVPCGGKGRVTLLQKFNIAPLKTPVLPAPEPKK
jgi:hypothetical protein